MWIRTLTLLALLTAPLAAQRVLAASPQEAIETSTAEVTVPTTVGGSLIARSCRTCEYLTVTLADTTQFFAGRQEISAAQFQQIVADGRPRSLTIIYDRANRTMTRVVVPAASVKPK